MSESSAASPPWLWIVTGPNGAGKSSFRKTLKKEMAELPWLNPDEIAANLRHEKGLSYEESVNDALGVEMPQLFEFYSGSGQSFIVETTTPGQTYVRLATALKKMGWKIGVIGINVASVGVAQERVRQRVKEGGHMATNGEVAARWKDCITKLPVLIRESDAAFVYDNTGHEHVLVASGANGTLCMEPLGKELKNEFIDSLEQTLRQNTLISPVRMPLRLPH